MDKSALQGSTDDMHRDHEVFISHSHKDKNAADTVCAYLEAERVRCWVAPRDVPAGEDWGGAIVRAIGQSEVMVLLLSNASNESQQVLREVERAVSKQVRIIPLRLEEFEPSHAMEYFISAAHWLNAVGRPLEDLLPELSRSVALALSDRGDVMESAVDAAETVTQNKTEEKRNQRPSRPQFRARKRRSRWGWIGGACALLVLSAVGAEIVRRSGWLPHTANDIETPELRLVSADGTEDSGAQVHPQAQARFEEAVEVHLRGREVDDEKALETAERLYHECLDYDANHVACHRNLAMLLDATDRGEKALQLLQRWQARSPRLTHARVELARLYYERYDMDTAEVQLLEAFYIDPSSDRVKAALSHLHEQRGELNEVRAEYRDKSDPFGSGEPLEVPTNLDD